jgi:hypothetical protein
MPFSLNNSSALIALATWWNNGTPTEKLDFSDCEPMDVQQLPNELIRFLATKITSVSLPRRLDQSTLPGWLSELKSIRELNVPDFVGEAIDLTPLNPPDGYTVEIGGHLSALM